MLWIHGAHGGHGFFIHGGHVFLVATIEILEEMFFKMLLRKKYCGFTVYLQTKSLIKIIDKNALFLRVLPWARETIGLSARFCLCIKIFRRIFN